MRLFLISALFGVVLAGCAGPAKATDVPLDDASAGRKIYVAKCAKCHKFYDPAAYSDEEWRTWMHKMSKKAKLSAEQELSLSSYIEATYRGGSKTNAPGAESQQ